MNFHPRPMLWTTRATNDAAKRAAAAVILVGGYDGSGNYGDIIQLEAALGLVSGFGERVVVLPVVELQFAHSHVRTAPGAAHGLAPERCLMFSSYRTGEEVDPTTGDQLEPLILPDGLASAVTHLYGGGYLNAAWGPRKLAMLGAVDDLVKPTVARQPTLVSSGLQIDSAWLTELSVEDLGRLGRLQVVGARDPASFDAAAALPLGREARRLLTWDDSLDALGPHRAASRKRALERGELRINLHLCLESWVTEEPEAMAGFMLALLCDLARRDGRDLRVQPWIAYEDDRITERPALERLAGRLVEAEPGASIDPPHGLRPTELGSQGAVIAAADLTLTTSYHVALTSLTLGTPAVLVRENRYYAQKSDGLRAGFGVPAELFVSREAESGAAAAGIARTALEAGAAGAQREALLAAGDRLLAERSAATAELGRTIAAGLISGLAHASEASGGGRGAGSVADLVHELAVLRADYQDLIRALGPAQRSYADLERRLAASEEVREGLLDSTSWKLTAPLRRLAALRRKGG